MLHLIINKTRQKRPLNRPLERWGCMVHSKAAHTNTNQKKKSRREAITRQQNTRCDHHSPGVRAVSGSVNAVCNKHFCSDRFFFEDIINHVLNYVPGCRIEVFRQKDRGNEGL